MITHITQYLEKDNHAMKFGQLIVYNMRKISVAKPDPFLKDQIEYISGSINSLKFSTVCFYCMLIWDLSKHSETEMQTSCSYPL